MIVFASILTDIELPRRDEKGQPADHLATRRLMTLASTLEKITPSLMNWLVIRAIEKSMRKSYPTLKPEWNLLPAPPPTHSTPIVNDDLIPLLASGSVTNVPGISKISKDGAVMMTDGSILEGIDAVILCTGYQPSFSILDTSIDPTTSPTPEYDEAPYGSSVRRYVRLYQGIFSPQYPESLAFIGPYPIISAFTGADVVSQAIAQVFSAKYKLPSQQGIDEWCDDHYNWSVEQARIARAPAGFIKGAEIEHWLNDACGNGLNEKLGWGLEGWKFWWEERELWNLIMNGVNTGFIYRLFDGRRKSWAGAKDAIMKANIRA